jgi:hypothetical protein
MEDSRQIITPALSLRPIRSVELKMAVLILVFFGASLWLFSLRSGLSLLLGGVLALINFHFLAEGMKGWVARAEGRNDFLSSLFFILKYPFLIASMGYAVLKLPIRPEAFGVGILCLVLAIVLEGLFPTKSET